MNSNRCTLAGGVNVASKRSDSGAGSAVVARVEGAILPGTELPCDGLLAEPGDKVKWKSGVAPNLMGEGIIVGVVRAGDSRYGPGNRVSRSKLRFTDG